MRFSMAALAVCLIVGAVSAPAAIASPSAPARTERQLRVQQGQFDSKADRRAFQHALGKSFGTRVKIDHPGEDASVDEGTEGDLLGFSVAISGDTAVLGAYGNDQGGLSSVGSAYVFVRSAGAWTLQAQLAAAAGNANDFFGWSVAVAGDTVLVGARFDEVGTISNQGTVTVFVRSGVVWLQQAVLTAADAGSADFFGSAVALSGDTALVGSTGDDVGANVDQGSATVFTRVGTEWTEQAKLVSADGAAGDGFGISVALSSDTALVGASMDDIAAATDRGSATVFLLSTGVWSQQTQLTAGDGAAGDRFGAAVSLSGNTALVGAPTDTVGVNAGQGSAYAFLRSGTLWSQQSKLTASDGQPNDFFGTAVGLSGNTAVVGADYDDVGSIPNQGSVTVFVRSGTVWTQQSKLVGSNGTESSGFGRAVAVDVNTTLAGAPYVKVGANQGQGSGYAFFRSGTTWAQQAIMITGDGDSAADDQFGYTVAVSGDTALIGAPGDDVGSNQLQGAAYVFVRVADTWTLQAQLVAGDAGVNDGFGFSIALRGDTALVGAQTHDVGANIDQGAAYVFVRSGGVWTQQAKLMASNPGASDYFGSAVALDEDAALIGAPLDDVGASANFGSATVFTRSGAVWTEQAQLNAADGSADDGFGFSVALSGDTALVGARNNDIAQANQGSVYVFSRASGAWLQQTNLIAADGATNDFFGSAIALVGDTALVGAPGHAVGADLGEGAAYVFARNGASWAQQAQLTRSNGGAFDSFGQSLAMAGEVVVVGVPYATAADAYAGVAVIFVRSDGVWTEREQRSAGDGALGDQLGWSVALDSGTLIAGAPTKRSVGAFSNPSVGAAYAWPSANYVTPSAGANGSISPSLPQLTASGATQIFTITADAGFTILSVTGCGGSWSGSNPYVTAPVSWDCTVTASFGNTPPSIAPIADQTILEDSATQSLVLTIDDAQTDPASLTISTLSLLQGLIANPIVTSTANPNERLLSFVPIANGNGGPVPIEVRVTDAAGASMTQGFNIQVTPVNDAPGMTVGEVGLHPAGTTGPQSMSGFATFDAGPDDEDATQSLLCFCVVLDGISDPAGILAAPAPSIAPNGTLTYSLTGVGGTATITMVAFDNGGSDNGGASASPTVQFTIRVEPGADLQIAKSNDRSGLLVGETTVYAIVVANAGPNAVSGAVISDILPSNLSNGSWQCQSALSTAACPTPSAGAGNLNASVDIGVGQYLRFDVVAEVFADLGASITNTVTVTAPVGIVALNTQDDSASDTDTVVPEGVFLDGFESGPLFRVPGAQAAMQD
jgi:uncharacterized repeat protein (TIGR01451 family)